jgi:hypothetical protein
MHGAQMPSRRDYCTSITSMTQTTIRGEQLRATRLFDLVCNYVYGPPSGVNNFTMIAFNSKHLFARKEGKGSELLACDSTLIGGNVELVGWRHP